MKWRFITALKNMKEQTLADYMNTRSELESEAARHLGQMLFEFSRLDVNLGLCLAWVDGGANLDTLSIKVGGYNFHRKLQELTSQVQLKLHDGSKGRQAYEAWLARADAARQHRNDLVHGRWGVDITTSTAVNVIGLPTSADQQERRYTLGELADVNKMLQQLLSDLTVLRNTYPL